MPSSLQAQGRRGAKLDGLFAVGLGSWHKMKRTWINNSTTGFFCALSAIDKSSGPSRVGTRWWNAQVSVGSRSLPWHSC